LVPVYLSEEEPASDAKERKVIMLSDLAPALGSRHARRPTNR
jgi:hypothetical protein